MTTPQNVSDLHEKALAIATQHKRSEALLLEVIIQVREKKVYRYYECASVYEYCVKILGIDAGVVYGFMAVANKSVEVPELKEKIKDGILTVSTPKRITSGITKENKMQWIEKAESLTIKKLNAKWRLPNP